MTCALDETWSDCLQDYRKELERMKLWDNVCLQGCDREQLLSSPEVMDPKTDTSFGWKECGTLAGFFASSKLTDVSKLTDDQLIDICDTLFAKETLYLRGRSVLQSIVGFVYVARLHELKAKNSKLYAYTRAVLRTLDFISRCVTMTNIRDEEEFAGVPPEVDTQGECKLEEILAELDEAIASTQSAALKDRFLFRKQLLELFVTIFKSADAAVGVDAVVTACNDAIATLGRLSRSGEPAVDTGLFRDEMCRWLSAVVPTAPKPTPAFNESVTVFTTMLQHIALIRDAFRVRSIQATTDFVDSFSMKKPLLATRCIVLILLLGENPNVSFLHGPSIHQLLLETLANVHGAPVYAKVIEGDEKTLTELAQYGGAKNNTNAYRQVATDAMNRWVIRASRLLLMYWESMLCNRGRAHRRITNLVDEISNVQMLSLDIDTKVFCSPKPGGAMPLQLERESVMRTMVLSAFVMDITFHVLSTIVQLQFELNLLSKAELPAALFYYFHLGALRQENLIWLYITNPALIPERRAAPRSGIPLTNPALSSRHTVHLPDSLLVRIEAGRLLADIAYRASASLESRQLLDLSAPANSLVPISQTFNNRMRAFGRLQRPGMFTYDRCVADRETLKAQPQEEMVKNIIDLGKAIADRTKPYANNANESAKEYFLGLEKAGRALSVSMNLLNTLDAAALKNFEVQFEGISYPWIPVLSLKRKATTSS